MGLLDEVLNVKKETAINYPIRVTPKKKVQESQSSNTRPVTLPSASILGSLIKDTTSSTPKTTSSSKRKETPNTKGKFAEKLKERRSWFSVSPKKDPDIKQIQTASLNVVGSNNQLKKKPKGIFSSTNITYRRGQNTKLDGQNIDNLSRTSSITNLDGDTKSSKGAKPKKSASRDRLDKIVDKKNDKKSHTKNNNKLQTEDIPYPSIDLTQEDEFLQLRRQLQEMAQEKTNLALQLGEQKGQLQNLQKEISKLKAFQEESNKELEHLTEENTTLRNRLRDVAHSPLSDNEKQQLLFESHRQHSSAPASIATNLLDESNGGDNTTCTTPDWDKHSSSNVSEVSVACLQDKINQMQETHYSTNEELQATLQELTDLQRQLTELQQENERLSDEKNLMFDSLCRQTERLNDSRSEIESLKQLLYQEKDDAGQFESAVEREQKLVALLKSAQEERESLMLKLEQLNNDLQEARTTLIEKDDRIIQLSERVKTLEYTLDAKHAEHKLLDQDLAQARDQCSGKQIEINRLTDLLENARTKIIELEQDRALSDKSELDEMLDNARKEKDTLESEVAHLKKQLALSKNEIEKLKEQVSILQEECKVTRNNARTTQSDLEYKCEKMLQEKNDLNDQIHEFQEALNELQVQSQCQLEDKRQLSAVLSETQRNLSEAERKNLSLENELKELKKLSAEENAEWEKFQSDLLTSVRVANDFKTEAQQQLQRMILENKSFRDREKQLHAEIEKLKGSTANFHNSEPSNMDLLIKRPKQKSHTKNQLVTYEFEENGTTNDELRIQKRKELPSDKLLKKAVRKVEFHISDKDKVDSPHKTKSLPQFNKSNPPLVKKRERTLPINKKYKSLSVEEEFLLDTLRRRYEKIEKLPFDKRSEIDNSIAKLKIIYDDENLKFKPVAPKPKDQLAISKPLLESVFHNPKLRNIAMDPNIKSTEDSGSYTPRISLLDKQFQVKQGQIFDVVSDPKDSSKNTRKLLMKRSYSCGDFPHSPESVAEISLYRSVFAEDLTQDPLLVLRRTSTILPSDSISNFRQSDTSSFEAEKKPKEPVRVSISTLDQICAAIPPGTSENQLTKEQKFALRLKQALDSAERKNTLKRIKKSKNVIVSLPTEESVMKNENLKKIMQNLNIPQVPEYCQTFQLRDSQRLTRSYEDISFSFDELPPNVQGSVLNEQISSSSSSDTLSNAEYDLDTYILRPCTVGMCGEIVDLNVGIPYICSENKCKFETFKGEAMNHKESISFKDNLLENNKSLTEGLESDNATISNIVEECQDQTGDLLYNETLDENVQQILKKNYNYNDISDGINLTENVECNAVISIDSVNVKDDFMFDVTSNESRKLDMSIDKTSLAWYDNDSSLVKEMNNVKSETSFTPEEPVSTACTFGIPAITSRKTAEVLNSETMNKQKKRVLARYQSINAKFDELQKLIHEDKNASSLIENIETTTRDREQSETDSTTNEENCNVAGSMFDSSEQNACTSNVLLLKEGGERSHSFRICNSLETDMETGEILKGKCHIKPRKSCINIQPKEESEYHYRHILKENKYGVVTPLNVRFSYKDVVGEIKNKFEDRKEYVDESDNVVNNDELETIRGNANRKSVVNEDLFYEETVGLQNQIDGEMEEIFEKYLHMPVSKLLTQSEVTNDSDIHRGDNSVHNNSLENNVDNIIVEEKVNVSTEHDSELLTLFNPRRDFSINSFAEAVGNNAEKTLVDEKKITRFNEESDSKLPLQFPIDHDCGTENFVLDSASDETVNRNEENLILDKKQDLSNKLCSLLNRSSPSKIINDSNLKTMLECSINNFDFNGAVLEEYDVPNPQCLVQKTPLENELTIESLKYGNTSQPSDNMENEINEEQQNDSSTLCYKSEQNDANNISVDENLKGDIFHEQQGIEKTCLLYHPLEDAQSLMATTSVTDENKTEVQMITSNISTDNINKSKKSENMPQSLEQIGIQQVEEISSEVNTDRTIESLISTNCYIIERAEAIIDNDKLPLFQENVSSLNLNEKSKYDRLGNPIFIESSEAELKSSIGETGKNLWSTVEDTTSIGGIDDLDKGEIGGTSTDYPENDVIIERNVGQIQNPEKVFTSISNVNIKLAEGSSVETLELIDQIHTDDKLIKKEITDVNLLPSFPSNHRRNIKKRSNRSLDTNIFSIPNNGRHLEPLNDFLRTETSPEKGGIFSDIYTEQNDIKYYNKQLMPRKINLLPVPSRPLDNKIESSSVARFSRGSDILIEKTVSNRLSFPTLDRKLLSTTRKVKSFAQHFEKLSADQKKPYKSSETLNKIGRSIDMIDRPVHEHIERKPQPLPRKMYQVNKDFDNDTVIPDNLEAKTMPECLENFSDNVSDLNMSDNIDPNNSIENDDIETLPKIIQEEYKREINEELNTSSAGRAVEIRRSEKFSVFKNTGGSSESEEQSNFDMRAEVSPSSIAVAGKFESLNLTESSDNTIEKVDTESDLNLFTTDSPSLDESYLNLFKSPEDVFYENVAKKRNLRGFINVVCVEEESDNESDDIDSRYEKMESILECESRPKIMDFVPLDDDATQPVFDKKDSVRTIRGSSEQGSSTNSVTDSAPNKEEISNLKTANHESFKLAKHFFEQLELHKVDIEENKSASRKN